MNSEQALFLTATIAGLCMTLSFLPQFIRVLKTKSAKDLSWGMLVIFSTGVSFWIIYGILRSDIPIIVFNILTLMLSLGIIILKLRYRSGDR